MLKRDEVQLELTIDQKDSINKIAAHRNSLKQLNSEYQAFEKQRNKLEKKGQSNWTAEEAEQYLKLVDAIEANRKKANEFTEALGHQREKAGLMGRTMKDLRSEAKELRFQLDNLIEGTQEFIEKQQKLDEVQEAIKKKQEFRKGFSSIFEEFKAQLPAAFAGGIAGGIAGAIVEGVANGLGLFMQLIDDAVEYAKKRARDISDIQTVLNVSTIESVKIYSQLNNIKTERSRDELKELVEVSGDLNVASKNVIGFVETADKIGVAFQRDFSSAGDAATMIAKLNQNYKETKVLGINDGLLKTGSAIRELNDDGAASTKGITEFLSRIGQLPEVYKPAISDTAALAAVMEEADLTAEISSGGISNLLLTASKNGEIFGKTFRMSKKDFLDFLTTDPIGFLVKFAKMVKNIDPAQMGELFKSLKLESQESVKALGTLSNNLEKFEQKRELAAKAFANGTRIEEIFRVFNNDSTAEISKAEKRFSQFTANIKGMFGGLGTSIIVGFAKMLPDTESQVDKITKKFYEQQKAINYLDGDLSKHIETIKDWKTYGHTSGITQDELKESIKKVGAAIPSAISLFDEYGRALDINTSKAEKNILKQRELAKETKKQAADINKAQLGTLQMQEKEIQEILKTGREVQTSGSNGRFGLVTEKILTDEEITKKQTLLNEIQQNIKVVKQEINSIETGLGSIEERRANRRIGKTFGEKETPTELDFSDDKADKAAKEAERLAETKLANEIRVNNEITRMQLEAIADEKERKLELLEFEVSEKLLAEAEKVKAGELSETTFINFSQKLYTDWIKEKTAIEHKYFKATENEAKKNAERLKKIREEVTLQIIDNDIKAAKTSGNDFEAMQLQQIKNEKEAEKEIALISAQQISEEDVNIVELLEDKKREIRRKAAEENLALQKEFFKKAADADLKETEDAEKKKREEKEKADKAERDREHKQQLYTRLGEEAVNALADLIHQSTMNRLQEEQQQSDKNYENRLTALEKQKNQGIITEEQYQSQRTALENQHASEQKKIRRKQAEADKEAAIFKATIDMLTAIVANLRNGVGASIAAGAIGAINLAKIASTKIPENYKGGYVANMTQALPFKKPSSTAVLSWLNERGTEYVVPAEELKNPQISGFIDNYIEPQRKQRIARHADGGYVGQKSAPTVTSTPVPTFASDPELMAVMREQNELLRAIYQKKDKYSWSDIFNMSKAQEKLKNNQNDAYYRDGL